MSATGECRHCGYVQQPGATWGYLDGARWVDTCEHVHGQRRCDCCSENWYAEGNDSTWDCDGCSKKNCPDCTAHIAAAEGRAA